MNTVTQEQRERAAASIGAFCPPDCKKCATIRKRILAGQADGHPSVTVFAA
jgi:hypothetical protein